MRSRLSERRKKFLEESREAAEEVYCNSLDIIDHCDVEISNPDYTGRRTYSLEIDGSRFEFKTNKGDPTAPYHNLQIKVDGRLKFDVTHNQTNFPNFAFEDKRWQDMLRLKIDSIDLKELVGLNTPLEFNQI